MAGRQLNVSVLVNLIDRLTSPMSRVLGAINRMTGGMMQRLNVVGQRLGAISSKIGLVGSALAAVSFATPVAQAANWDSSLRNIGITAGLSGAALERMISATGMNYEALALKVGQSSRDIAAGAGTLVAAGMDPKRIEALLPTIGKVATAANASFDDIARTSFALSDALKVPADQMEKALAGLVVAGKAGRFELADMSKYFPALTSQMAQLGVTGTEAISTLGAGLQIAMKGAADPSQAATNMQNFLSKLTAPETLKNFEKAGVNLTGVMQDAVAKGINPIEAVMQKVGKITGVSAGEVTRAYATAQKAGLSDAQALQQVLEQVTKIGGAEKIGKLFGDQQVLQFLLPLMANLNEYRDITQQIKAATPQVITTDFTSQMASIEHSLKTLSEMAEQVMRRVGRAFSENLGWITNGFNMIRDGLDWMDEMAPGSANVLLSVTGAVVALAVGIGVLAPAVGIIGAGFGVLGAIVGAASLPVIAIVAVLAGAAALIMSDWKTFKPFFERLWNGVKGIFTGALRAITGLFKGDFAGVGRGLRLMWEGLKTAASAGWSILKGVFNSLLERIRQVDWWGVGIYALNMIVEGLKFAVSTVVSIGGEIADKIRSVDWWEVGKFLLGKIGDGVSAAMAGVANIGQMIVDAIEAVNWVEVGTTIMSAIWNGMKSVAGEITNWLNGLFAGGRNPVTGRPNTPDAPADGADPKKMNFTPTPGLGGTNGLRQASAPASQSINGRIVVEASRGSSVRTVESSNKQVALVADRGRMLGRA